MERSFPVLTRAFFGVTQAANPDLGNCSKCASEPVTALGVALITSLRAMVLLRGARRVPLKESLLLHAELQMCTFPSTSCVTPHSRGGQRA